MAKHRAVIRLQMESASKKQVDEVCEKRGMTQIAVLSRVVKWFGKQDEVIQARVLGLLSDDLLSSLLEKVPVHIITNPSVGLLGAAAAAGRL